MTQIQDVRVSRAPQSVAAVCVSAVAAISILALIGRMAGLPLLTRGFVGNSDIRPNAAAALLCAAIALLFRGGWPRRMLGLVPVTIGALTTIEYAFGVNLGIDALLFAGPVESVRMSLRGAIALTFAGVALMASDGETYALWCALAAGFIGALSAVAHVYGANFLPHANLTPVALSTALLLVLWTIAFFIKHRGAGLLAAFLLPDRWGRTARELAVIALLVPAVLGAFCVALIDANAFDAAFAIAILTTTSSFTLVLTIGRYTVRLRTAEFASHEADAMYRTIVETSQEGICIVDSEQRFTFVNGRFAKMLGYMPEELLGKTPADIAAPDERAALDERAAARRAGQHETQSDIRLLHRNGSVVHVLSAATTLRAGSGLEGHALATVLDITRRVNAERQLRESEARFRSLYESNLVGVAFWASSRKIVEANDAFLQIFRLKREQLEGWDWSGMNPPGGAELDEKSIAEMRRRGRCGPFEKELVRPDGSSLWVLMALASIGGENNIGFFIDITERAAAQRQLERAHEILAARVQQLEGDDQSGDRELETLASRLAEAHEELETFSYSVSHDLRAPLRAIDGFSRELQTQYADRLDETGQQYLRRVRAATQRMALLIDDLLSLSRLSRKPMRRADVDVTAMATEVANELRERAGREVALTIAPGLTASADPHLLRVVLENLLGNAVKFSSRRSDAHVEVFAQDGELAVRDNGAGFDPRYIDKIFAPFQRLHSNEFEGTGIGLALVQRIVHRHGGSIRAESEPDRGATFFFTLGDPVS